MKKILIALILLLLPSISFSQKTDFTRSLKIKNYDQSNADAQLIVKGVTEFKDSKISLTLGYGHLFGTGWTNPKSSWGRFGSGIANSDLLAVVSKMGPEYLGYVRDYSWGRNGFNFLMEGKIGKMGIEGAYSGYLNSYSFGFSGELGSLTGKGFIISNDGKIKEFRSDIEIKF